MRAEKGQRGLAADIETLKVYIYLDLCSIEEYPLGQRPQPLALRQPGIHPSSCHADAC